MRVQVSELNKITLAGITKSVIERAHREREKMFKLIKLRDLCQSRLFDCSRNLNKENRNSKL